MQYRIRKEIKNGKTLFFWLEEKYGCFWITKRMYSSREEVLEEISYKSGKNGYIIEYDYIETE